MGRNLGTRIVKLPPANFLERDDGLVHLWPASVVHELPGWYEHAAYLVEAPDEQAAYAKVYEKAIEVFGEAGEISIALTECSVRVSAGEDGRT